MAKERSPLLLVAHYDGKVAGFITGQIVRDGARWNLHITKLIVDREWRRMGIGGHLMRAFTGMAESAGCDGCLLEVNAGNRNAISLYTKLGFKEKSVVRGYYPDGSDMLKMEKIPGRNG